MDSKILRDLRESYGFIYNSDDEMEIWEEVVEWAKSRINEGHDLSGNTLEKLYEYFLEEQGPRRQTLSPEQIQRNRSQFASRLNRVARGIGGTFSDFPAATMSQLQGWGANRSNDAALERQGKRGENLRSLITTGRMPGTAKTAPTSKPQPPKPLVDKSGRNVFDGTTSRPATTPSASKPTGGGSSPRPTGGTSPRPSATPAGGKVAPTAAAKPPTPTIGKLGNTSFERRTPTSAELRAAQAARKGGASPEKALQAAQRTNLPTQGPTPAIPSASSVAADVAKVNSPAVINRPAPAGSSLAAQQSQQKKNLVAKAMTQSQSYEWPTAKTIRDIANAYSSIYEAKKKVDQDQDGDNDFADVRIARMIASGVPKEVAIAKVKSKSYNEEVEIDEATRMRKELGKEGEIETRQELARRSKAFKRSDSVDKTIAAAERGADRPYIKHKRDESDADRKKREEKQSRTLRGLAASRRGSVRDTPRVELRGYAAKVEGSDKNLQRARSSAMSAGTLTPKEKKQLGEEYQIYEIVASYLLENNFAETLNDANIIIENMSENWVGEILESFE